MKVVNISGLEKGSKCCYICTCSNICTAHKRSLGQGNDFTPVCHSVHGGVYPSMQWGRHPHWADTPPGRHPLDSTPSSDTVGMVNKLAVRILLECILVSFKFNLSFEKFKSVWLARVITGNSLVNPSPHLIGRRHFYRPQRSWGKVILSQASVILLTGGRAWLLGGGWVGGMCGCSWGVCGCSWDGVCMVAPRGHVWLLLRGHAWLLLGGGHAWLLLGGCAWLLPRGAWLLLGGCVWLLLGGIHGCSWGGHAWLLLGGMHGI